MSLYLWFTLMIIVSALWLIWFVNRPLNDKQLNLEQSNIDLGKQRLLELEQDLAQNLIDQEQFEQAKKEVSQTLAVELDQAHSQYKNSSNIWVIVVTLVLLPVMSIGIYQHLTPEVSTTVEIQQPPSALETSAIQIKQHLVDNPNDFESWQLLGLTYFELNKLADSVKAYQRAYQINPNDFGLLIEYASTMISINNNQFTTKSVGLVKQALTIDPNAPEALYLAGMFAASIQDFNLARELWSRALNALPEGNADREVLMSILAELKTIESSESVTYSVSINVELSAAMLASRSKEDFVMVYVKAAQGRPMPIAIQRVKLKDFSGQIVLTDQDSVMSNNPLSAHDKVLAVVRLSSSGSAMKQKGDVQVTSQVLNVSENPSVNLRVE